MNSADFPYSYFSSLEIYSNKNIGTINVSNVGPFNYNYSSVLTLFIVGGFGITETEAYENPISLFWTYVYDVDDEAINPNNGASVPLFGRGGESFSAEGTSLAFSLNRLIAPVPEPQSYLMMLIGLGLLGFLARRSLLNKLGINSTVHV